jgi:hypothetical protein
MIASFAAPWIMLALLLPSRGRAQRSQTSVYHPEEIEWTWEVRPDHANPSLPNVLLVGDSISRNYFPEVRRNLKDVANVYLFASSICVGDPRLENELEEFSRMEGIQFRVVHFNNGLHGWQYTDEQYRKAFPAYLDAIRALSPNAVLIWASSTPMKKPDEPGASNRRVDARDKIALKFVERAGILVDDQHELMMKHQNLYQDNVHFNDIGSDIQGRQAANLIRKYLK